MEQDPDQSLLQLPRRASRAMAAIDTLDPATFDWNAYCGTYKGRALITRLSYIPLMILASNEPSPRALELARAAALRALPIVKAETLDHNLYLRLVSQIDATLNGGTQKAEDTGDEPMDIDMVYARRGSESEGRPDASWVEEARTKAEAETNRLAVELNGYLSNLIKESIRLTYLAQAQLAVKTGSLPEALKAFQQVREYSSGAAHHVELGLGIVVSALQFNDTTPLSGNVTKIESSLDRLHPPVTGSAQPVSNEMTQAQVQQSRDQAARSQKVRRDVGVKLRVARGLLSLQREGSAGYANAAREFGQVGEEGGLQDWEGEVISSADLALLTTVCALASGERADIKSKLLDRPSFHASIDDSQNWILDLVRAFVGANYAEALKLLRKAEPYMVLNPFLSSHAGNLVKTIRKRALQQYVKPFSTVRVSTMAAAFETDEQTMLNEICSLAENDDFDVRIDLVDGILTVPVQDPRIASYRTALENGGKITAQTRSLVFRMRLKEADIIVGKTEEEEQSKSGRTRGNASAGRYGAASLAAQKVKST